MSIDVSTELPWQEQLARKLEASAASLSIAATSLPNASYRARQKIERAIEMDRSIARELRAKLDPPAPREMSAEELHRWRQDWVRG